MSNVTTIPLSSIEIFRLSGSLWGGETALKAGDLDPAVRQALPPKELASLGRKRVYPAGPLENLRAIRYRAYMALRRFGCSIFSGDAYAVDPAISPKVVDTLRQIKTDFDAAKHDFIMNYEDRFEAWVQGIDPRWEPVIRAALPSVPEVEKRVSFGWQQFRLAEPSQPVSSGDTLQEEIAGLGGSVFQQLADMVSIQWNRQKNSLREASSWKRGVPDSVRAVIEKARNCAMFDPALGTLADTLEKAAASTCVKEPDPVNLCTFRGLLLAMQDPENVRRLASVSEEELVAGAAKAGLDAGMLPGGAVSYSREELEAAAVPDCSEPLPSPAPSEADLQAAEEVIAAASPAAPTDDELGALLAGLV
jgi:hypothetical protein